MCSVQHDSTKNNDDCNFKMSHYCPFNMWYDNVYHSENKAIPADKYITRWYSVEHVGAGQGKLSIIL